MPRLISKHHSTQLNRRATSYGSLYIWKMFAVVYHEGHLIWDIKTTIGYSKRIMSYLMSVISVMSQSMIRRQMAPLLLRWAIQRWRRGRYRRRTRCPAHPRLQHRKNHSHQSEWYLTTSFYLKWLWMSEIALLVSGWSGGDPRPALALSCRCG